MSGNEQDSMNMSPNDTSAKGGKSATAGVQFKNGQEIGRASCRERV